MTSKPYIFNLSEMERNQQLLRDFGRVDLETLLLKGVPPTEWILPKVIARGRYYILGSTPKAGKTVLAMNIALWLALQRPPMIDVPEGDTLLDGGGVLYLDRENTLGDVAMWLSDLKATRSLNDFNYLRHPRLEPLDTRDGGEQLMDLVEASNAKFVVIDVLSKFVGGEENYSSTWKAFYNYTAAQLKEKEITLLGLDHLGKNRGLGLRGSSAKFGDVDGLWILDKKRAGGNEVEVVLSLTDQRGLCHAEEVHITRTIPLRHEVTHVLDQGAGHEDADQATPPRKPDQRLAPMVAILRRNKDKEIGRIKARELFEDELFKDLPDRLIRQALAIYKEDDQ